MSRKKIKLIILFFLIFVFSLFSLVLAQGDRELEVEYPEISGIKPETVATGLPEYVKYIFNFTLLAFGLLVLGLLVRGGINYLIAVGQPAKLREAKDQMVGALLGLIILLSSYLIFATINPQLTILKLPFLPPVEEPAVVTPTFEEEMTLISYEIPIGQMIDNGIWQEQRIQDTKALLDEFEGFLKEDTTVNPTFNRISDLNKYLKTLTDSCRCDVLETLCTEPENWASKVGCTGDPCEDVREKITGVLTKNDEKMQELLEYKNRITQQLRILNNEREKFLNAHEKLMECLSRGNLLTRNEYLEQVKFYEEQGWETKVIPNYVPSKGDALTFYCSVGGTIFDMPVRSPVNLPEEIVPQEMPAEMVKIEPLSCPAVIPVGELLDQVAFEAFQTNDNFDLLLSYIDELTKALRDMADRVSECNEQNCEADCRCVPNPCYLRVCGCIPVCPGDPPFPNPCWPNPFGPTPNCFIPCLQAAGVCYGKNPDAPYHGSPCPRDRIEELVGREGVTGTIKLYEDEIFEIVDEIKASLSADPFIVEGDTGRVDLLTSTRAATSLCFSENTDEPTWAILNCGMALGNYGPDGGLIETCHPQSFFCCTSSKEAAANAPSFPREPSSYYKVGVVTSGECNERIIAQASLYNGILYRQFPTSTSHCAPLAKSFGPDEIKDKNYRLDCSGFASRVYRDLGIFPPEYKRGWCHSTSTILFSPFLREISASDVKPGDLIVSGSPVGGPGPGYVVIFASGEPRSRFQIWHEGGCPGGSRVCTKERGALSGQRYFRRVYDCGQYH